MQWLQEPAENFITITIIWAAQSAQKVVLNSKRCCGAMRFSTIMLFVFPFISEVSENSVYATYRSSDIILL